MCENLIGTWSAQRTPSDFTVEGARVIGNDAVSGNPNNGAWPNGNDPWRHPDDRGYSSGLRILGSLAMVEPGVTQNHRPYRPLLASGHRDATFLDLVGYSQDQLEDVTLNFGNCKSTSNVASQNCDDGSSSEFGLVVDRVTAIAPMPLNGSQQINIGSHWENESGGTQFDEALDQSGSVPTVLDVFSGSSGAQLCSRYVDGVDTGQPLWPWPMGERILAATELYDPATSVDVDAIIEERFGEIPQDCLDSDQDGIRDSEDNCTFVANGLIGPSNQLDTDRDGYGNACDFDFLQNGASTPQDVQNNLVWIDLAINVFGFTVSNGAAMMDMDGSGVLDSDDIDYANLAVALHIWTGGQIMRSGYEDSGGDDVTTCADPELKTSTAFPPWAPGSDPGCPE